MYFQEEYTFTIKKTICDYVLKDPADVTTETQDFIKQEINKFEIYNESDKEKIRDKLMKLSTKLCINLHAFSQLMIDTFSSWYNEYRCLISIFIKFSM